MTLGDAADGSTVVATLQTALATSRAHAAVRAVTARARAHWRPARARLASSRSVAAPDRISDGLATTGRSSTTRSLAGRLSQWIRASSLYRWLTTEPDPDVVVINLRETYVVGPVIALLDWLAAPLGWLYRDSTLQRLVEGAERTASALANTRVGQAFGRVLAPPEPPDRSPESDAERATRSRSRDERDDPR
jgi:hypothetical protein